MCSAATTKIAIQGLSLVPLLIPLYLRCRLYPLCLYAMSYPLNDEIFR